jgi:hypothetical protein
MSTNRIALRFVTLLFLLAGLLLLKKPVFGQTAAVLATKPVNQTSAVATPLRFSLVIEAVVPGKDTDIILIISLNSSRDAYAAEAKLLTTS